jgi:epoxyqueuosine reductase QueG
MATSSELKVFCKKSGADVAGIADLALLRDKLPVIPHDLLDTYHFAISLGIRLRDDIINTITNCPTGEYADHCRDINNVLNDLSSRAVKWIGKQGYSAFAVPASQKINDKNLLGNISHKAVARMAGLGWQGKSLLIVNPEYGPRLRLVTVLTDMPLEPDEPIKNRCGKCTECFLACPASAIKNASTDSHYKSRDEAIHLDKCYRQLLEFQTLPGVGYTFCGVCIKVCPFGKKTSKT